MKENFKLDYQDNYKNMKISKVIDEILNNISSMEKLETNKRRKNSFKQVPKLISILFKSLEEVKRNEIILKNVIEILDSVKLFFHQMKLNYLKKDEKIPINFTQLKTVIKYIYTLFQIKVYNSKLDQLDQATGQGNLLFFCVRVGGGVLCQFSFLKIPITPFIGKVLTLNGKPEIPAPGP